LLATSLLGVERNAEALVQVDEAVAAEGDDPGVLTRAASHYFYGGEVDAARECCERADAIAPKDFVFQAELRELRRAIARRYKHVERERALHDAFEADRRDATVARDLAKLLARQERTYAAYVVVLRALQHNPEHAQLRKLRDRIARDIPPEGRDSLAAEARAAEARG
jgi:tetratricopeptide (TPR) repeat protein